MSGGSFNYFFRKVDPVESFDFSEILESMRTHGYEDVAERIEKRMAPIVEVLHAYEWLRSFDIGPDEFDRRLNESGLLGRHSARGAA